jgi:prophage regulatory protein
MARISEPERRRRAKQSEEAIEQGLPQLESHRVTGWRERGMPQRILRRAEVEQTTGLPRATIYDKIAKGMFPRPIKLGERSVGWLETEIIAWQKARIAERDGAADDGKHGDRLSAR